MVLNSTNLFVDYSESGGRHEVFKPDSNATLVVERSLSARTLKNLTQSCVFEANPKLSDANNFNTHASTLRRSTALPTSQHPKNTLIPQGAFRRLPGVCAQACFCRGSARQEPFSLAPLAVQKTVYAASDMIDGRLIIVETKLCCLVRHPEQWGYPWCGLVGLEFLHHLLQHVGAVTE